MLASIDIGSNSFRLEIAQLRNGQYRRIDYLKDTVRLGAGLDANGRLTEAAAQRGLACLTRFRDRVAGLPATQLRAVATQTLREATNRNEFLRRAEEVLGHPIEIIAGREEARLIYKGVARLQPSQRRRLVIDIGGRSTEMIIGQGTMPLTAESFRIGSVSLSGTYFPDGRYTEQGFRAAQVAAGAELEEALDIFHPGLWQEALGSSGTAGAVSQLLAASRITDGTITPEGLRWCMHQCLAAGHQDALQLPGLKPERRAVLGGGIAILMTLTSHFGITALQPAKGALRQGVIFDLDERLGAARDPQGHDLRDDTVQELQQRFCADAVQAERVRTVALGLLEQIQPSSNHEVRHELAWAATLHEIGMMVSHHDHHRHSAYLIAHADAPGFSQNQQRRLGELLLGQRGGLRKVEEALTDPTCTWQLLCLRLALLLCHARSEVPPDMAQLGLSGRSAVLTLDPNWAEAHPRTLHLLREEVQAWHKVSSLRLLLG